MSAGVEAEAGAEAVVGERAQDVQGHDGGARQVEPRDPLGRQPERARARVELRPVAVARGEQPEAVAVPAAAAVLRAGVAAVPAEIGRVPAPGRRLQEGQREERPAREDGDGAQLDREPAAGEAEAVPEDVPRVLVGVVVACRPRRATLRAMS